MLTKDEVAINLRKFAKDNFKSIAELGRQLGMRPQNLQIYFEGRSYPGGQVLGRLSELGCDIDWLLTGDIRINKYIPIKELEDVGLEQGKMYKAVDIIFPTFKELESCDLCEESLNYNEKRNVFVNIDDEICNPVKPLLKKGDKVMVDLEKEAEEKNLVLVKFESGKQELRLLAVDSENKGRVALLSYNPTVAPIFKKRKNITMHQVVLIKKK